MQFSIILEWLMTALDACTSWLSAFIEENSFAFFFFLGFFLFYSIVRFLLPVSLRTGVGSSDRVTKSVTYEKGTFAGRKVDIQRNTISVSSRRRKF